MPETSSAPVPAPRAPVFRHWLGRSMALALASFCLLNVAGSLWARNFDATLWLLDLRFLPHKAVLLLVGLLGASLAGLGLGVFANFPRAGRLARMGALVGALAAFGNALVCWRLWWGGAFASPLPVPFSLVVMLALLAAAKWCGPVAGGRVWLGVKLSAGAGLAGAGFIFVQMSLFGLSDYRAPADVAVVYGARAFSDGRCSHALQDRVLCAVELYKQGLVPALLMSGGPVDGAKPGQVQDEPEAMKRLAMAHGVPESAILLDPLGVSTVASAQNTGVLAKAHHWRRILIVSHFYHLSRAKLTMQRAGVGRQAQVRSVPSPVLHSRMRWRLPKYMLREVAAFAKDWLAA